MLKHFSVFLIHKTIPSGITVISKFINKNISNKLIKIFTNKSGITLQQTPQQNNINTEPQAKKAEFKQWQTELIKITIWLWIENWNNWINYISLSWLKKHLKLPFTTLPEIIQHFLVDIFLFVCWQTRSNKIQWQFLLPICWLWDCVIICFCKGI